ncbi:hypothetical protein [Pseudomonas shirazensis]
MAIIEIFNDDSHIVIDDTRSNHRLLAKSIVASAGAPAMNQVLTVNQPVGALGGGYPLLAVRGPSPCWLSLWATDESSSPSSVTWRYMTTAAPGSNHEVFVFQDGNGVPMTDTGMMVLWNELGEVIFNSDEGYASIVDLVQVTPGQDFTKTYPAGRKYAISNTLPMVWRSSGGPGGSWTNVLPYGAYISDNTIRFARYVYRGTASSAAMSSGNNVAAWFMVLDVTGL